MYGDAMGRKVQRVSVSLDSSGVSPLSDEEIRTILRGADDLIMSGIRRSWNWSWNGLPVQEIPNTCHL